MGTNERPPREATIQDGNNWSTELRAAVLGLARHCCRETDRPAMNHAARAQYDGRSWMVATDGYRALFVADALDVSGLNDAGLDGIHRTDLQAAAKRKLYDGPITLPVHHIDYGHPNVVGCIPAPVGAVTVERVSGADNVMILDGHEHAGFERGLWRVRDTDGDPGRPLACRPDFLHDAADALNTNRLNIGWTNSVGAPFLVRDAHPVTRAGRIDGFALVMPQRIESI